MRRREQGSVNVVFVLAIACLFVVMVLAVLLLGARVYRSVSQSSQAGRDGRTALAYITTKVHSGDSRGDVQVGEFEGQPALFLLEEYDGVEYETILYAWDGWMYELFCEPDSGLVPEDGELLMPCGALTFRLEGELLTVTYTGEGGETASACVALRSGGEGT